FEPKGAGAVVQPLDVLAEPKDLAAVDADALEDAVAVEEAVVVDADLGVGLVEKLAVDVDPGCHDRLDPPATLCTRNSKSRRAPSPAAPPGRCRRRCRGCESP